ncbi:hypothetical protein NFI96_001390 [Prochilodus magdalenae]|nr:hypothetical protein NFI96_001390 [Prochilodus magdalenae]
MGIVAFLADIMSHLNGLNLQLQGKNNFICDLMTAVRSIQRKLQVFKEDLQGDYTHFPKVKEQVQGHRDVSSFVDFVDKLIENFSKRFDSFSIGEELTLFIQNPFLITDVRAFTNDVTHHFKWANTGPQMIDLQADVALKEQFARTESTTFWLQMVSETAFPDLKKVALFILTMFGSTYSCEAASSYTGQLDQNAAARLVFSLPRVRSRHSTAALPSLASCSCPIRFKTLMLTYEVKNGPALPYLMAMVNSRCVHRALPASGTARPVIPEDAWRTSVQTLPSTGSQMVE